MIENLKPVYNKTLRPVALVFSKAGLHPNHLTITGLLLFAISGYFSSTGKWYSSLILVIAGSLMDGLDGVVARETGKKSTFGAILDSTCDRLTEIFLLFGIMLYYLKVMQPNLVAVIFCFTSLSGSIMVSYVKARCEGAHISCKRGIMQRPERLIILCFGLLTGPDIMFWILILLTSFTFITVIQRVVEASIESRKYEKT